MTFTDRLFGLAALAGFLLSLAVHLCALFGIGPPLQMGNVWWLHVGIFVVFIPFVLSSRKVLGARPGFAQMRAFFPAWVIVVGVLLFAYVFVNFWLFMQATEGGSVSIRDGKYILADHGRLIRELTAAQYAAFQANEVRGFSGHWMAFYFGPFAYFLLRRRPSAISL